MPPNVRSARSCAKAGTGVVDQAIDEIHLRAERGVNILCYERKRSDHRITRINGIVILEPQRFIQLLPAIDSTLLRVADGAGATA